MDDSLNQNSVSIANLEARVSTLEQDSVRNTNSHSDMYGRLTNLEKVDTKRETEQKQIMAMLEDIKADVSVLKEKPIKQFDGWITTVRDWITLAALGYIALKIGIPV